MKIKILLVSLFLITSSLSSVAQHKKLSATEVQSVCNGLCTEILLADTSGFDANRFNKLILDAFNAKLDDPKANRIVSNFLNKYKNQLICGRNTASNQSRKLSIYKRALLDGVIDLFDEILLDDDKYQIDFNGYQMWKGKKETLLDYIDYLIKMDSYGTDELESIRGVLIELGAKYGKDLK